MNGVNSCKFNNHIDKPDKPYKTIQKHNNMPDYFPSNISNLLNFNSFLTIWPSCLSSIEGAKWAYWCMAARPRSRDVSSGYAPRFRQIYPETYSGKPLKINGSLICFRAPAYFQRLSFKEGNATKWLWIFRFTLASCNGNGSSLRWANLLPYKGSNSKVKGI